MPEDYPTFEQYQQQVQQDPGADQQSQDMQQSIDQMSSAASNLNATASTEMQQTNMMLQTMQAQQNELQTLTHDVERLTTTIQSGQASSMSASLPAGPPVSQGGGGQVMRGTGTSLPNPGPVLKGVGGAVAGKAAQYAGETAQYAGGVANQAVNHAPVMYGAEPGHLVTDQGLVGSMYHQTGLSWNPQDAQQYSMGAYSRALQENAGNRAADLFTGGMSMMGGYGSSESLGGMAGGFLGGALGSAVLPFGGTAVGSWLGNQAGSAVGRATEAVNPLSYGIGEFHRSQALASPANDMSSAFLRGRDTRYGGHFSTTERNRIGEGVRQMSLTDRTFETQDFVDIQRGMQETGQFLGVQNSEEYVGRLKKGMDTVKTFMKTFHQDAQEATQMMDRMFSDIGLDHGQDMTQFAGRLYASQQVGGLTTQQAMGMATQGASMARGSGLMSTTGADIGLMAGGMAGQAATHTVGTDLLATVGGEQGLAQMLQQSQISGLRGGMGTMLGAGGQYDTIEQGVSQAAQGLGGSGDLMDFVANRHRRMQEQQEGLGAEGVQAQQFVQLQDMASKMGGGRDMTQMLAAQTMFGGDTAKAEAYIKSMEAMPETMRRNMLQQSRAASDMEEDMIEERGSIKGQLTYGYRDVMNNDLGGNSVAGFFQDAHSKVASTWEGTTREMGDWWYDKRRDYHSIDQTKQVREESDELAKKLLGDARGGGRGGIDTKSVHRGMLDEEVADAIGGFGATMYSDSLGADSQTNAETGGLGHRTPDQLKETIGAGLAMQSGKTVSSSSELMELYEGASVEERQQGARYALKGMQTSGADKEDIEALQKMTGQSSREGGPEAMSVDKAYEKIHAATNITSGHYDKSEVVSAFNSKAVKSLRAAIKGYMGAGDDEEAKKKFELRIVKAMRNAKKNGGAVEDVARQLVDKSGIKVDLEHSVVNAEEAKERLKDHRSRNKDIGTQIATGEIYDAQRKSGGFAQKGLDTDFSDIEESGKARQSFDAIEGTLKRATGHQVSVIKRDEDTGAESLDQDALYNTLMSTDAEDFKSKRMRNLLKKHKSGNLGREDFLNQATSAMIYEGATSGAKTEGEGYGDMPLGEDGAKNLAQIQGKSIEALERLTVALNKLEEQS